MTNRLPLAVLAALLLGLGGAPVAGQEPAPPQQQQQPPPPLAPPPAGQPPVTFRAEVNYVEVDARVVDDQGRFVSGLSAGDFQVFEDGAAQAITVFSEVNLPVERAPRPLFASEPIEPDVATNLSGMDGRIYLVVLDDLHTHMQRSPRVRLAARQFIERYVGANDVVAIVYTSGRSDAAQEFTNNQRLLLASVDKFMGRKVRSSTLNRIDQASMTSGMRDAGDPVLDPDDAERGFQARSALDSIRNLSTYLGGVSGRRKAMVLFSEGIDYDISDPINNRDATNIMDSTRDLLSAATRANVAIYSVDPRGLSSGGEELIEVASFPSDQSLGIGTSSFYNETRISQDSLRVLAGETGGFAVVNQNDFGTAFQRIVDDNSSYYVLGYYATNERRDGRFRKIDVKVPARGNLTVRARKGYIAGRGRAPAAAKPAGANDVSEELREAMSSPLPLSELPMAVTAAVFKGPQPNGSVVISTLIGGGTLPLEEKDGTFRNNLELAVVAVDQKGKSFSGGRNTVDLNMKPDTAKRAEAIGFRVISSLDLPPGRYTLRVGARESNTRKAGSVSYDLEVPEFTKDKLLMSSLAITSAASSMAPTARAKDPLSALLPGPLSAFRDFPQGDELAVFAEVYDNSGSQPHKVDIAATVKAEGGQTVFQTSEERDSSELKGSSGGYGFVARIPLKDVAPGLYVLRVEAQSRLGDRPETSREVIFRVGPEPHP